jgi:hypothetical protein
MTAPAPPNKLTFGGWTADRWATAIVLGAFALLLAVRYGFRGINVLGAKLTVS